MEPVNDLLTRRHRLLGPNVPTFYSEPVHIVRGRGEWLWDADGRRFLDCYNNVPHVGHCHPTVVQAIARQAEQLNTHTRYLHAGLLDYVERLTELFAEPLSTAILVCSGSEANDVALRMARTATTHTGIIATDNTYHGNTDLVSQLSSRTPPPGGRMSSVRRIPSPIGMRTAMSSPVADEASAFAAAVQSAIDNLESGGHGVAALIVCPFFANEGFPALETGFLDEAVDCIHRAGGLVIADEVQPGFGRLGSHFWGHQRLGFQPDIVTLGKPMANGHPVAAIVTQHSIMGEFRNRVPYFNTFGGNPVSVAAAAATLDVIEEEGLVARARDTGDHALERLSAIAEQHPSLAATRGSGLFFGGELVLPDGKPDTDLGRRLPDAMRQAGVLLNVTGRYRNILKIRPPMAISNDGIDLLCDTLERVLEDLA
ncbi:MAG: aspartate aminotransferase family protein [Paracoccaceae bacterium]|nr:aspartate aminotransferase family protein [Paracoccaceae bacterium]MDE2912276.1 aspartate aminotransferase family protein [Paracoccaceae bacterium]